MKPTLESIYRQALEQMCAVPATPENTELRDVALHALLRGMETLATDPGAKYDRAALVDICNPIAAIHADAEARGERIEEAAAKALSRDPEHLRMMAAPAPGARR